MLTWFIISIIAGCGMAVAIVEKGDRWPVHIIASPLRRFLRYWYPPAEPVLDCTVCLSFWTTLLADLIILLSTKSDFILWPLSGFGSIFITWIIYELFGSLDDIKPIQKSDGTDEQGM